MRELVKTIWQGIQRMALTVVVLGLLAGTGYAFLVEGEQHDITVLRHKLDHVERCVEQEKRENRRLKLLITRLKESDTLVEKMAREDNGLIKEGEILYVFPH